MGWPEVGPRFAKGHTFGFKPGQSGNPAGRKPLADDIHALARPHAAEAIAGLVEFMRQREDCHLAMSALLDRGYGRPPQALLAQVRGEEVVRYEITWGSAKESEAATIDATATSGDAEEAEAPLYYWGDGTRAG
jgi:hypothetical protein